MMKEPSIWELFRLMMFSRRFEEEVKKLWEEGKIFGEMHMGIGEESINAGVVSQLIEGDALALDHRGTAPMIMAGVDPLTLLLELMGHPKGLCKGMGGHMHLYSKEHLAASSGIVGASGPTAVGFALASTYKKTDNIVVAFFGEGSMNQGMLMESMNLASAWNLPVLFVCKDNKLSITTMSKEVTGGTLLDRAIGFGIEGVEVDGNDVGTVWKVANEAITNMRKNGSPFFIHAHCLHKDGHLLGDPLLQSLDMDRIKPLIKAMVRLKGVKPHRRFLNMFKISSVMSKAKRQTKEKVDPYIILKKQLRDEPQRQKEIEAQIEIEIINIIEQATQMMQEVVS
ncbi:MAG: thiamine pyrophosphate-dependent dehydrogenase E1 component subunit alpha [Candidatus Kariarchaeaceae archaeon]|jgi:pyruvate dehydrogenase E1 component alpha subunit